jgi:ribosomal protein L30E
MTQEAELLLSKCKALSSNPSVYIYTMQYYSDIKKNEIMTFSGKSMELGIIVLSK